MNLNEVVFQKITIEEAKEKGSLGKAKFLWAVADKPNLNGRVYPKSILSSECERIQAVLNSGDSVFGSDGHPVGSANLSKVSDISHMLSRVWMKGDECWGEAEILDTSVGRNCCEVLKRGKLGVSLRGTGDTKQVEGKEEVQDNFKLLGIDFVLSPSFPEAMAQGIFESAEFPVEKLDEAEEEELNEAEEFFNHDDLKTFLQIRLNEELGLNCYIREIDKKTIFAMVSDCDEQGKLVDHYMEIPYSFDDKNSAFILEIGQIKYTEIEKGNPVVEAREDLKFGSLSEMEMKISGAKENFGPEKIIVLNDFEKRFLSPKLAKILRDQKYSKK